MLYVQENAFNFKQNADLVQRVFRLTTQINVLEINRHTIFSGPYIRELYDRYISAAKVS